MLIHSKIMTLWNFKSRSQCLITSHIFYYFRNSMKLKNSMSNNCRLYTLMSQQNFIKPFVFSSNPSPTKLEIICNKNLYRINSLCSLRWTRWSKPSNACFINSYSRKKNKRINLEEKLKLQTNKLRETKKRFKKTIVEFKENILTIPNGLCVIRIMSTPVLGYLVISECYSISLGLFIFAGFTDLIDGCIARNFPSQQSMIGSFLDPAADKLLISTLFITLTVNGLIPVPLTSLIILRDVCLMSAGFYIRYVSLPPPKTLRRYFDMSLITAKLQPTALSKANTVVQLTLAAASLAAPVFCFVDHFLLEILWYVTGTTTVLSAASYWYYKKSTYKLFNDSDEDSSSSKN